MSLVVVAVVVAVVAVVVENTVLAAVVVIVIAAVVVKAVAAAVVAVDRAIVAVKAVAVVLVLVLVLVVVVVLIWPDGSAPAALASLLFKPPEVRNVGKAAVLRVFSTFSRACIIFLPLFSSLTLPTSAFRLSILSEI